MSQKYEIRSGRRIVSTQYSVSALQAVVDYVRSYGVKDDEIRRPRGGLGLLAGCALQRGPGSHGADPASDVTVASPPSGSRAGLDIVLMKPPYSGGVLRARRSAPCSPPRSRRSAQRPPRPAERRGRVRLRRARHLGRHLRRRRLRGARAHGAADGRAARQDRLGRDGELRRVGRRRRARTARPASSTRCTREAFAPSRGTCRGTSGPRSTCAALCAMLTFRTPAAASSTASRSTSSRRSFRNAALRSRRAVALTRELREAAGDTPLAIVPFNPRGLERRPSTWPRLPVGGARRECGRVRADGLHGRRVQGLRRDVRLRHARAAAPAREHRPARRPDPCRRRSRGPARSARSSPASSPRLGRRGDDRRQPLRLDDDAARRVEVASRRSAGSLATLRAAGRASRAGAPGSPSRRRAPA